MTVEAAWATVAIVALLFAYIVGVVCYDLHHLRKVRRLSRATTDRREQP